MKTLKRVLLEKYPNRNNALYSHEVVEMMQFVREETLKECAKKSVSQHDQHTISSLDKNSIDL